MTDRLVNGFSDFRNDQNKRFDELDSILRDGFDKVANELKLLRTEGMLPATVVKELMDRQHDFQLKNYKLVAWIVGVLVLYLTGLKFGPELAQWVGQ